MTLFAKLPLLRHGDLSALHLFQDSKGSRTSVHAFAGSSLCIFALLQLNCRSFVITGTTGNMGQLCFSGVLLLAFCSPVCLYIILFPFKNFFPSVNLLFLPLLFLSAFVQSSLDLQ